MMTAVKVAGRELQSFFNSAIAYAFTIVYLLLAAVIFFVLMNFFLADDSTMRPFFEWLPWLFAVFVPALTMRSWAEERKLRTDEVLLTLPATSATAVVGKFLAALVLLAFVLLATITIPITVGTAGSPDWGPIFGGYAGAILLGASMASLGLLISSLFGDQVVAFIVSMLVMFAMISLGFDWVTQLFGTRLAEVLRYLSWYYHFEAIARGVMDSRDLVFFASSTCLFLILNTLVVEVRRR